MISDTAALNATPVNIRNGASIVRNIQLEQRMKTAAELYVQIYNINAPTVGTDKPVMVLPVPAGNTLLEVAQLSVIFQGPFGGRLHSTALSIACTTTPDGLTAPTGGQEPRVVVDYNQLGA